ncbi:MAG TPA: beta-ketoacyl synthase N-terminal-like domain-containing protein [Microvirga sp.]|jgi:3-oxoacyl-[acyl-carrier-protein] synthase II|nr:beta-ketoacyl synthase N-terminal-like domain-containing protein [Microvirga sp.]
MSKVERAVYVTGMGMITSLALGVEENWSALSAGRSGIRTIDRFDTANLRVRIAATASFGDLDRLSYVQRTMRMAEMVADEALEQAGLPRDAPGAPLILGIPPVEMQWRERLACALAVGGGAPVDHSLMVAAAIGGAYPATFTDHAIGGFGGRLAERHGFTGAPILLNTACSTGATAIQMATEMIRDGHADRVVAIATDAPVTPDTIVRFSLLAALSMSNERGASAARPFSADRDGFVLGEGAAALVLESVQSVARRGVRPIALVAGLGESADTFHLTRSSPDASAASRAMFRAIDDAGIAPADIGYVNAHGTGTPENDRIETLALLGVFGEGRCPPVSSSKSMIGHTLSAAGAVEAVIAILALTRGLLPPTINRMKPDPEIPLDVVPDTARPAALRHVLSNSFGFGGQNVSLVFSGPV